jgi:hypothetical protein
MYNASKRDSLNMISRRNKKKSVTPTNQREVSNRHRNLKRDHSITSSKPTKNPTNPQNKKKKIALIASAFILIVGLFSIAPNYVILRGKTPPNLQVSQVDVGKLTPEEATDKIQTTLNLATIELLYKDQNIASNPSEAGITINNDQLSSTLTSSNIDILKPWYLANNKPLPLNFDESKLAELLDDFEDPDFSPMQNAGFTYEEDTLVITESQEGFGIDHRTVAITLKDNLQNSLGSTTVEVSAAAIAPDITKADINENTDLINSVINNEYVIAYDETSAVSAPKADIASWISLERNESGDIIIGVNEDNVKTFVQKVAEKYSVAPVNELTQTFTSGREPRIVTQGQEGKKVVNTDNLAQELINNVQEKQGYTGKLEYETIAYQKISEEVDDNKISVTHTYTVETWGNVQASLSEFKSQAAQTLNSVQGWSGAGIAFQEVSSNGSFTLVLAEPSRVGDFSVYCSSEWSCRVGRYVIINDLRWREATTAWNNGGGSLRDYRHMVVNHEVGHWLGFGHLNCPGAGQLAPVMQQQSMSLQGCRFNPWPTTSELNSL